MEDKIKGYMELMKEPWDHMGHEDLEFCGIKANDTKRYKTMNKVNLPNFNIYIHDYNIFFSGSLKGLAMALIYIKANLTTM